MVITYPSVTLRYPTVTHSLHLMKLHYLIIIIALLFSSCMNTSEQADTKMASVPNNAFDVTPLLIGESIPDITLENHQNEPVNLLEASSENTLFVFYRGGWCPFCSAELADISSIENQLYEMGLNIIAISPDRPEFLRMPQWVRLTWIIRFFQTA